MNCSRQGTMGRFVTEAEIKHAIFAPPKTPGLTSVDDQWRDLIP